VTTVFPQQQHNQLIVLLSVKNDAHELIALRYCSIKETREQEMDPQMTTSGQRNSSGQLGRSIHQQGLCPKSSFEKEFHHRLKFNEMKNDKLKHEAYLLKQLLSNAFGVSRMSLTQNAKSKNNSLFVLQERATNK